jgi:hypothetical protein
MYSYKCSASGAVFDRFESMKETGRETVCRCGASAPKFYQNPPMGHVESDCPPHIAPGTGEQITSNRQRREFMARNGLMDANDFTPEYQARKAKERREKVEREAAKAYEYLPNGMKPETVLKEVLND